MALVANGDDERTGELGECALTRVRLSRSLLADIGAVWTNMDTVVSRLAESGRLGATMGAAGSFKEFGDMVGPLLIGILSRAPGLAAGFVICSVVGRASVLLLSRRALEFDGW